MKRINACSVVAVMTLLLALPAGAQTMTIWDAADEGDITTIKQLVSGGADVNGLDIGKGHTPIIHAILAKHPEAALALIEIGADVNKSGPDGRSPLTFAAEMNQLDVIKQLAAKGADLNAMKSVDPPILVPLGYAAVKGNVDAMKLLLQLGAKRDTPNPYGAKSFTAAVVSGQVESLKLLISKGSELGEMPNALYVAAKEGRLEMVRYLVEQGSQSASLGGPGHTVIGYAAKGGHHDVVMYLLAHGAPANSHAAEDESLLSYACAFGDLPLMQELVMRGVKWQEYDNGLKAAVKGGFAKCIQIAFENGATATLDELNGLLDESVKRGDSDVFVLLEQQKRKVGKIAGAQADAEDQLIIAAASGDTAKVKDAIAAGVTNPKVLTAAQTFATQQGQIEVLAQLKTVAEQAAKTLEDQKAATEKLMQASLMGDFPMVKSLLDQGVDPYTHTDYGLSAISGAIGRNHIEVIKLYLDHGLSPNATFGAHSETPLQGACGGISSFGEDKRIEVVKLLLERGADPNLAASGDSPLVRAARDGSVGVVKLLLDHKADVNSVKSDHKCTALMSASEKGHDEVVKLLLDSGANAKLEDDEGLTALDRAQANAQVAVVELLKGKGGATSIRGAAMRTTPSMDVVFQQGSESLKKYLDGGGDPNAYLTGLDENLLKYSVSGPGLTPPQRVTAVRLLIEKGVDMRANRGILNHAIYGGSPVAVISLLLQHGADVNEVGTWGEGWTPLLVAAQYGTVRHVEVLLQAGADIDARKTDGQDAIALAKAANKADIVAALEKAKRAPRPTTKPSR